jgi:hypothetical protein
MCLKDSQPPVSLSELWSVQDQSYNIEVEVCEGPEDIHHEDEYTEQEILAANTIDGSLSAPGDSNGSLTGSSTDKMAWVGTKQGEYRR